MFVSSFSQATTTALTILSSSLLPTIEPLVTVPNAVVYNIHGVGTVNTITVPLVGVWSQKAVCAGEDVIEPASTGKGLAAEGERLTTQSSRTPRRRESLCGGETRTYSLWSPTLSSPL
jgi:hypothetical protein